VVNLAIIPDISSMTTAQRSPLVARLLEVHRQINLRAGL
jgi:hypothetical protein